MTYLTISLLSFIFVLIADVVYRLSYFVGYTSTVFVLVLNLLSLICLLKLSTRLSWKDRMPPKGLYLFRLFMVWNFFTFIRGMFSANDYWDWKILLLTYAFSILIPLSLVIGINFEITTSIFKFNLDRLLVLGLLSVPVILRIDHEVYPRAMASVSLLILLIPYLKHKWRVFVVITALTSIFIEVSYRSNLLRVLFPFFLLIIYFNRRTISLRFLNLLLFVFSTVPLIFLVLGLSGEFNIFHDNPFDYQVNSTKNGYVEELNMSGDTRTLLYQEVFSSMVKRGSSFIIGEGGGAGYDTYWFQDSTVNERGRFGTEVGFLNTLLYSGAVGVSLYGLMLFLSAYYAINRSNNSLCKMLGLFLGFHWMLFFIEDIPKMDLNFYIIWLAIGLCMSNKFRSLSDLEIKKFFYLSQYNFVPVTAL